MEAFWRHGFEAADVGSIASAAGVTKPSLYGQFGGKAQLFMRALARYGKTIGSAPMRAFFAERNVTRAIEAFLVKSIENNTEPGRPAGCLFACVAGATVESVPDARLFYRGVIEGATASVAERFRAEMEAGALPSIFDAEERARMLIDFMQATALRARAGEDRDRLLASVPGQVQAIVNA